MRIVDILKGFKYPDYKVLKEYVIIKNYDYFFPNFSAGKVVGKIQYKDGMALIYKLETNQEVILGALKPTDYGNPNSTLFPIGYLGFDKYGSDILMATNAFAPPEEQRKGILSELFYFANHIEKYKIFSDLKLSTDGEQLWKSIVKSDKFDVKILYIPTLQIFSLNDIYRVKTPDDKLVLSPLEDDNHDKMYSETIPNGQIFSI